MQYFKSKQSVNIFVLFMLLFVETSYQCGTGRSRGSSRRHRKMTPLVFKQHVPNVSENTLGASGLAEGRIDRNHPNFEDLVANHNPDIIFKDEEGTGADRLMSQRCKDKLNTLAISVMNRWPGVKLRVIEAWDEDGRHARDSLHYEGRAVDITPSDRDRTKYGMLARLAVEAGFDWVYYENRAYIHCSVKSDSSIAIKTGGCFPGNAFVQTLHDGLISIDQLQIGEPVLSVNDIGEMVYSKVILFAHIERNIKIVYHIISTESGQNVTVTAGHLIYKSNNNSVSFKDINPVFVDDVSVGDYIYTRSKERIITSKVKTISRVWSMGSFAPITQQGTVVVNNVALSCYAMVNSHRLAHWSLTPMRLYYYFSDIFTYFHYSDDVKSNKLPPDGIHWFIDFLHDTSFLLMDRQTWFYS